jgi:hypothetical protein
MEANINDGDTDEDHVQASDIDCGSSAASAVIPIGDTKDEHDLGTNLLPENSQTPTYTSITRIKGDFLKPQCHDRRSPATEKLTYQSPKTSLSRT